MTDGQLLDHSKATRGKDLTLAIRDAPRDTPAFVYDLDGIESAARRVASLGQRAGYRVLNSVKALSLSEVLDTMVGHLDGFSASSLDEARLARKSLDAVADGRPRTLHWTSPGLRPDEAHPLAETCDVLAFNSLAQWRRFGSQAAAAGAACGLRVNPQLSWVEDKRCDPCRPHSKLGVPLDQLVAELAANPDQFDGLAGLHFHTNHAASDTRPLAATAERLCESIGPLLRRVAWLNVGGGYRLSEMSDEELEPLVWTVDVLRSNFGLEVLVEPGATLVRRHGYLVATVIDLFDSSGEAIAVLDTSVAHLAEVFEFQRPPVVMGHEPGSRFTVTLAGASCLAGDLLGRCQFVEPITVGSRIVLQDVGAYALSKVQRFNGLRPPAVWLLKDGRLMSTAGAIREAALGAPAPRRFT